MNCREMRQNLMGAAAGLVTPGIENHLQTCAACAKRVEQMRRTMELLDEWKVPEPSPDFDARLKTKLHAENEETQRTPDWLNSATGAAAMFGSPDQCVATQGIGGSVTIAHTHRTALKGAVVLYGIICFEILIMISPFAGFFYSAFNPALLGLTHYRATRWLTAFFFPHLVVPPTEILKIIRIVGSVLFVAGLTIFLSCALRIYGSKVRHREPATGGVLYGHIRHPQYLGLSAAGLGTAILWPRFLVVVLWTVMVLVYYWLGKDEERRMLNRHPKTYSDYMNRTGMFVPRQIEEAVRASTWAGKTLAFVAIAVVALAGAFLLRGYTVRHLPVWVGSNVVAVPVVTEDKEILDARMAQILKLPEIKSRLIDNTSYLAYVVPQNYVMQGLLADTGGEWRLYKQHHSLGLIADWVLHPFGHVTGKRAWTSETNCDLEQDSNEAEDECDNVEDTGVAAIASAGGIRRVIFVKVLTRIDGPADVFAIDAIRTPAFMIDLDMGKLMVRNATRLPVETAWGKVPTPVF